MKITLVHLFSDKMNIYGDWGNIEALLRRAKLRGIEVEYVGINKKEDFHLIQSGDLFFFGGGQDTDQMFVWKEIEKDIEHFKSSVLAMVDSHKVFLLICGGFQLFGKFFIDAKGQSIPGIGILDIETRALGKEVSTRCIGNIVIEHNLPHDIVPKTLVGFENHGGQTYFTSTDNEYLKPLGKVIVGHGNNLVDGVEGCIYRNVFGSYMHGSLLPKNPHFADYLIQLVLEQKYPGYRLNSLDSHLELLAHEHILEKLGVT
ncbi:MAG: glutamine amidotransferase [Patescibacteria group bacterium]